MVQKTLNYFRVPKKLFWGLLGGLTVLALFFTMRPKSLLVDTDVIKKDDFQTYIIDEGTTRYKNRRVLTAPADGITPALDLDEGMKVKKNQTLFHFIWDKNIPIQSPLDGVILKIFEKDRRSVTRGTPLIEVGDPKSIEILSPLLSEEVVSIKLGQKALITKWGGPEILKAQVTRISPAAHEEVSALGVKEQRVDVFLELEDEEVNKYLLGDGFRLEVKIIKQSKTSALLVPIGALFRKNNETAIFLVDENSRAKEQIITVGERNQEFAEVLTPVQEGQRVILYPSSQIKEGIRINIRK